MKQITVFPLDVERFVPCARQGGIMKTFPKATNIAVFLTKLVERKLHHKFVLHIYSLTTNTPTKQLRIYFSGLPNNTSKEA